MLTRLVKPVIVLIATFALAGSVLATTSAYTAQAASGYNAANIIHDANFFTAPKMSAYNIQQFLNAKGARCRDKSGAPCLKNYRQTTSTRPADKMCPRTYQGARNESAAQILYKTSLACNIAPEVLLVTLEKEQSLVTSNIWGASGYRTAMGYGCPDGAACNQKYYGFANQVYNAAHQFQRYRLYPRSFNFAQGRTSFIQFNPKRSCGGTRVTVANAATAALYNYTPYQPGGKGKCATYGNYNFHRLYTAWFGNPQVVRGVQKPSTTTTTPTVNKTQPTGTQSSVKKQAENGKATPPEVTKPQTTSDKTKNGSTGINASNTDGNSASGHNETENKQATNNQKPVEFAVTSVTGESVKAATKPDGKADGASFIVDASGKMTIAIQGMNPDTQLSATMDGTQTTLSKNQPDAQGKITVDVVAPNKPGNHELKIYQSHTAQKSSQQQKSVTLSVFVRYGQLTLLGITDPKSKSVTLEGVPASSALSVALAGVATGDQLQVRWVKNKDTIMTDLGAAKADQYGKTLVNVKAPTQAGTYIFTVESMKKKQTVTEKITVKNQVRAPQPSASESEQQQLPKLSAAKDANGNAIVNGAQLGAGSEITLTLTNLKPGVQPLVEVHSTPIKVPTAPADKNGTITATIKVPDEAGIHHVKVGSNHGQGPALTEVFTFEVLKKVTPKATINTTATTTTTAKLAKTGQETGPLLALMIVFIGCGIAFTSYAHSRQPISVN